MQIFSTSRDDVIRSSVSIGQCTYAYAIEKLVPLLDRFGEQRKIQSKSFYARLRADILKGCIMPPLTLAFDNAEFSDQMDSVALLEFIEGNIENGYILDGMQRLNTLLAAADDIEFEPDRIIPVTVIIAEKYDLLLYRMITLNNGQKPMTARHQIEMLTRGLLEKPNLSIDVLTEKETETKSPKGAFKQSDVSEAYIAFMSDSLHNQNARIIATKLDELLVTKVMDSNVSEAQVSFLQILECIDALSHDLDAKNWLRLGNNLIGFSVGAKTSLQFLQQMQPADFGSATARFETAFDSLETSKVNVGKIRREWAKAFVARIEEFWDADQEGIDAAFIELIMPD